MAIPPPWRIRPKLARFLKQQGQRWLLLTQLSTSWRMAQVRGTSVTKPMPVSRHSPKVRGVYALESATRPHKPSRPNVVV
jgi:hypothetical protein